MLSANPSHCQQVLNIERDDSYLYFEARRRFAEPVDQAANQRRVQRLILQILIIQ